MRVRWHSARGSIRALLGAQQVGRVHFGGGKQGGGVGRGMEVGRGKLGGVLIHTLPVVSRPSHHHAWTEHVRLWRGGWGWIEVGESGRGGVEEEGWELLGAAERWGRGERWGCEGGLSRCIGGDQRAQYIMHT